MTRRIKFQALFLSSHSVTRRIHGTPTVCAQFDTHDLYKQLNGSNELDKEKSQAIVSAFSSVLEDR